MYQSAPPNTPNPFDTFIQNQKELQAGMKRMQQRMDKTKTDKSHGGNSGGGGAGHRTVGKANLAHVHPILMEFFGGLHTKFNGRIMFEELMELSGKTIGDIPTHPAHNNEGRNGLCYNWLGGCLPISKLQAERGTSTKAGCLRRTGK